MFWWFVVLQQVVYSFALLEYRGNWEQNSIQLVVGGGGVDIYLYDQNIFSNQDTDTRGHNQL